MYFRILTIAVLTIMLMGCKTTQIDTSDTFTFQAKGNSPIWVVDVQLNEISLKMGGMADQTFSYSEPIENEDGLLIVSKSTNGNETQWLKLRLKEKTCELTTVGKKYPYRVELVLDDTVYYGCGE